MKKILILLLTLLVLCASAALADTVLRPGDTGSAVRQMQQALVSLGFSTNGVDGKYGAGTVAAVRAFQAKYGLTVDGKAGPNTLNKLYALAGGGSVPTASPTSSPSGAISGRTDIKLVYGNSGDQVRILQQALTKLGFTTNGIDGKFGAGTLAAVKAFQTRYGLTVDGKAGPNTLKKLYSLTSGGTVTVSPAAPTPTPSPSVGTYTTLRSGATGADVTNLQTAMKALDYNVTVTGTYDDQTISWVRIFQSVNGLSVDGIAGKNTQACLYGGNAKKYVKYSGKGITVPNIGEIKLMHWFNEVKPSLSGSHTILIYDPNTTISFTLYLLSLGRHADCEPLTAQDTELLREIFGGETTWTPKFVYVKLPSGQWTVATLHDTPHESQTITNNNFDGHMCVHFLRDMSEVSVNDPNYGVTHQKALRAGWLALTGEVVE